MRIMGLPPHRIREFERYLKELAPLLRGEESTVRLHAPDGPKDIPIRHIMADKGFVNFDDPIPLYVSGFGPRSLGLAGAHGDGAVLAFASSPSAMENIWFQLDKGARESGKSIDRTDYYTTALAAMVILEPGEAVDSPRVKHECGAMAMATIHYSYDQWRNFGHQPPGFLAGIWDDYTALLEKVPEATRHQRIHAGHNCWVIPEEEKFLTPDVLTSSCLIGTQDVLIERLSAVAGAGLDQLMILPNFDPRYEVLEDVATKIMPYV